MHVQLVHVTPGGGESVEWSGTLGPFAVTPGVRSQAVEVPMVRGPPGNLSVTGIQVQPNPPPPIFVDQTLQLTAEVTTNDPGVQPVVFWTSLDPGVAGVSGTGRVTPVGAGTARIQVVAGSAEATVNVVVRERPPEADLELEKSVNRATVPEGGTVVFRLVVRNAGPEAATLPPRARRRRPIGHTHRAG